MQEKTERVRAYMVEVRNLDRTFGQVGEDEGYVLVRPEEGYPLLFTHLEVERAKERALDNPEDAWEEAGASWLLDILS